MTSTTAAALSPATGPDDLQLPAAIVPEAAAPETPATPVAASPLPADPPLVPDPPAPVMTSEAAEPEAAAAPADAATVVPPIPRAAKRRSQPKPQVSEETLAPWQASLAADRQAKAEAQAQAQREAQARQRAAAAARERAARTARLTRERAAAFRTLRDAVQQLDAGATDRAIDPALAALAADRLARDVHAAPAHVRSVLEATLRMLVAAPTPNRRGRRSRR